MIRLPHLSDWFGRSTWNQLGVKSPSVALCPLRKYVGNESVQFVLINYGEKGWEKTGVSPIAANLF